MDPINNPFAPGAGSPPPELVGRDLLLEQARILLGRIKIRNAAQSMLLTGLRGVGKTVLLNEIKRLAQGQEYRTLEIEAHEDKPLGPLIAPHLRTILYDLDRLIAVIWKLTCRISLLLLRKPQRRGTVPLPSSLMRFNTSIRRNSVPLLWPCTRSSKADCPWCL